MIGGRFGFMVALVVIGAMFLVGLAPATEFVGKTYSGEIRHGYGHDATVTVFTLDELGKFKGEYTFLDELTGKPTTGVFDVNRYDASTRTMNGTWKDRYGSGTMRLTFTPKYDAFTGRWGERNKQPQHVWHGRIYPPMDERPDGDVSYSLGRYRSWLR